MKKCLLFIFVFGITFSLWNIKAFAYSDVVNNTPGVILYTDENGNTAIWGYNSENFFTEFDSGFYNRWILSNQGSYLGFGKPGSWYNSVNDAIAALDTLTHFSYSGSPPSAVFRNSNCQVIIIKGTLTNSSQDLPIYTYEPPPPPDPSWWEEINEELLRQLGLTEGGMLYPFVELWQYLFPDDEVSNFGTLTLITPTPIPPLPTSIPYSTTIDSGTGEIHYHYNGITSTLPPPEPTYTITLPPDQGIVMPSGIVYSDEGLQEIIDSVDDNLIDYQYSIETIRDSFSTIPVKWFVFFGLPAAIILIAGVIKSLLG